MLEQPGRTPDEAPQRGHGPRVRRQVEVAYRDGRVAQAVLRVVVVPARQLAQPPPQPSVAAPGKDAAALADHGRQGHAQWCACRPDAATALAAYEGQGPGRRGRRPRLWRSQAGRYASVAEPRRKRRARRGRPAQLAPPPLEAGARLVVEVEALATAEEDKGWTVLATTVDAAVCPAAAILQAYQDQDTTVEPGCRWSQPPAASAPVWLEKPERMAA